MAIKASISLLQYKVLVLIPTVSGLLSLIGSATIILIILRSVKKLTSTYHRLVFSMSCMDIIFSVGCMLSTLPSPKGSAEQFNSYGMYGSTFTCTLQGIAMFSGTLGVTMYNCFLSIFFVLKVVKAVRDETIKKRVEPFFYAISIVYILCANVFLLKESSFNTAGTICFISSSPHACETTPELDCARGGKSSTYFWIFYGIPEVIMFFIILFCMVYMLLRVRRQELKVEGYHAQYRSSITIPSSIQSPRSTDSSVLAPVDFGRKSIQNELSRVSLRIRKAKTPTSVCRRQSAVSERRRQLTIQCFLYVSAYFSSIIFVMIFHAIKATTGNINYPIWVLTQIFTPLQGCFNCMVYIRPHVASIQKHNSGISLRCTIIMLLKGVDISTIQKNHGRSSVQKAETNVQHESSITCNPHKQDHNNETDFRVKEICFEKECQDIEKSRTSEEIDLEGIQEEELMMSNVDVSLTEVHSRNEVH